MNTSLIDYKKPFDLPLGLKQKFTNEFNFKAVNSSILIKMKDKNSISDRDIEIAKFIFKTRFATLNQIHRYLELKTNKSNLKNRLEKLVSYRVLNKFTFVTTDESKEEQLGVYCLDIGGRHLLSHYSTEDTTNWNTSVNMKAPELVGENLLATEFYIRLLETCKDRLVNFELYPTFRCGDKSVVAHFKFSILVDGKKVNFIADIVRDYHLPDNFAKKAEKYESILMTNAWKKYFREDDFAPILLTLSSSDKLAKEVAETINMFTRIDFRRVRLSTDERIKNDLGERGTFLKYEQLSKVDTTMALKTSRINIF